MAEPAQNVIVAFPEPSTFEDAWKLLPKTMRERSVRKDKCEAMWNKEAKRLGGQHQLLLRLKTYLRDNKDLARSGGPGLQVLMNSGKLEHWVPASESPTEFMARQFENMELRKELVRREGAGWVASYLDPCTIDGTTLIVRTGMAVDKLKAHGALFKAHGLTGMKKR